MTSVAYPGPEGAHSAAACDKLFPDAEIVALPSFEAVAAAVTRCEVEYGVLPMENTFAGPVAPTHDLLYDSALCIARQTTVGIRHALVGLERIPREEIRVVRSHPMALDQCRELLAALPWATAIAAPTTSGAAAQVAATGDRSEVAISSERAAQALGLVVIEDDVGDHHQVFTRFVAVATHLRLDRADDEDWRIAFSFVTDHQPGALFRTLEPFARHGLDLVQLVSRPIPKTPWRYRFDAVLAGFPLEPVVSETLAELRTMTRELRVFGSYPVAG
ncbi:MAG: chorismate mutase / prephenate dehydratase [Gaiellaceae bacterium]|nr:chorismate mutase / prephenate dehydratase [Gaiellaceae bacterium]